MFILGIWYFSLGVLRHVFGVRYVVSVLVSTALGNEMCHNHGVMKCLSVELRITVLLIRGGVGFPVDQMPLCRSQIASPHDMASPNFKKIRTSKPWNDHKQQLKEAHWIMFWPG